MKETSSSIDRGWAWVILTACTFEAFFLIGYIKSFGLYFVEFLIKFNTDAASMSSVIMIQTLTASVTALLVLNIGPLFVSNRVFMIVGSVVLAASTMTTGFAPNIGVLTLSSGILFGIGMGCTHAPALVMVSLYFEKRRGLANGVANLGASIGGFGLPLFIRYLLDYYCLRGSLIIISGIMLNIVICAALMRPIEIDPNKSCDEVTNDEENNDDETDKTCKILSEKENITNVSKQCYTGTEESRERKENEIKDSKYTYERNQEDKCFSKDIKTCCKSQITYYPTDQQKLFLSYQHLAQKKYATKRKRTISEKSPRLNQEDEKSPFSNMLNVVWASRAGICTYANIENSYSRDIERKPTFISEHVSKDSSETEQKTCDAYKTNCLTNNRITWQSVCKKLINLDLIKNRLFLLLFILSVPSVIGCALPVTFIPPHAKDLGIKDKDIALLLSIIGGSDLVGRIFTICLADRKFLKCSHFVAISLFLTGIALNLAPVLTEFWSLAVLSAVYGIFAGVYLTLFPVVLIDFIGLEGFSSGMGLLCISHGGALTVAIPIIGILRDHIGSYVGPLHLMGTCLLTSSGLLLLEPLVRKWEEKRSPNIIDSNF